MVVYDVIPLLEFRAQHFCLALGLGQSGNQLFSSHQLRPKGLDLFLYKTSISFVLMSRKITKRDFENFVALGSGSQVISLFDGGAVRGLQLAIMFQFGC
jgi:hypothetical protein